MGMPAMLGTMRGDGASAEAIGTQKKTPAYRGQFGRGGGRVERKYTSVFCPRIPLHPSPQRMRGQAAGSRAGRDGEGG